MGYVAFTRFCCESSFVASMRFFGFALSDIDQLELTGINFGELGSTWVNMG